LRPTPEQTEGPFFPLTKPSDTDWDLTRIGEGAVAKGDVFTLEGRVVDVGGTALANARIEIWQTDHQGIYLHPGDARFAQRDRTFQGYGDVRSVADGSFRFRTIQPARYPGRARHIHAKITAPGLRPLTTQFYFAGDPDLARDGIARRLGPALASVSLDPKPAADGSRTASLTLVLRR
jgi:protocatechuate 3,4-dioxygenase beta subunit